jgi:hypothetical protein
MSFNTIKHFDFLDIVFFLNGMYMHVGLSNHKQRAQPLMAPSGVYLNIGHKHVQSRKWVAGNVHRTQSHHQLQVLGSILLILHFGKIFLVYH